MMIFYKKLESNFNGYVKFIMLVNPLRHTTVLVEYVLWLKIILYKKLQSNFSGYVKFIMLVKSTPTHNHTLIHRTRSMVQIILYGKLESNFFECVKFIILAKPTPPHNRTHRICAMVVDDFV